MLKSRLRVGIRDPKWNMLYSCTWRMHYPHKRLTTHTFRKATVCISLEFYIYLHVRHSIIAENYQLNDVWFTISYDSGHYEARKERLKLYSTRAKGWGRHPRRVRGMKTKQSSLPFVLPFLPPPLQTLNTRDSIMEINARWHGDKFHRNTHTGHEKKADRVWI